MSVSGDHGQTPRQIGRFRVDALIGRGGMGEVYRGYDPVLQRDVALKVVRTDVARPEFVDRLLREALACARLQHPRIVTIFEASELDGGLYIAMEFLKGTSLEAELRRGPPSAEAALRILGQVLEALAHAHAAGVVHRDIKPSNVLSQPDGNIKLVDFGLARLADAEPLTRLGEAMGTPQYASPEQLTGAATDHRTDIYSAGVLAFELFTGRRPFGAPGDTLAAIVYKVLTQPVPQVNTEWGHEHPGIDAFVARAMAKEPAERFASVDEMRSALEGAVDGRSVPRRVDREAGTIRVAPAAPTTEATAGAASGLGPAPANGEARGWPTTSQLLAALVIASALGFTFLAGRMLLGSSAAPQQPGERPIAAERPISDPTNPQSARRQPSTTSTPRTRPDAAAAARLSSPGAAGEKLSAAQPQPSTPTPTLLVPAATEAATNASESRVQDDEAIPSRPATGELRRGAPIDGDEAAIRALLHAFETAFANQSTPELRRLQPSLDNRQLALYESRFLDVKAFVVQLQNLRFRLVSTGRVAINCVIQRDVTLPDDSHRVHSGAAIVTVERDGDHWRIVALQAPSWW